MSNPDTSKLHKAARQLYTSRFCGLLATNSTDATGYPFGSLVPYCLDREGIPLLLISHLAQHTQNIVKDPRCSLTIVEPGGRDVQKLMRLTCIGDVKETNGDDRELPERYFRYFPEKRDYYRELNFRFFRIRPARFYFIGGFGAARWLGNDRILRANPFFADEETELLTYTNGERPELLHTLWNQAAGETVNPDAEVVTVGIDADGLDLRLNDELYRLPLPKAVCTTKEVRDIIGAMA